MRILKVTQSYSPYSSKGGLPAKVSGIARALAERGHEVTVLTADWGPADFGPDLRWRQPGRHRGWEFRRDGVEAVYLPTLASYRGATLNPGILTFCLRRLHEYDVAHVYGLYDLLGCVVARSCRHRRLPYVLEPLGMFGIKVRSKQKKRLYHRLIGSRLISDAQVIIATSEIEKEELINGAIPEAKILLRRDGVDPAEFQTLPTRGLFRKKLGISDQTPLIFFLGRLSFIKGLDILLQAFARVHTEAKLVIAGPDDRDGCLPTLRRLIQDLNLSERVILSGPLYDLEKLAAFVDADLCVYPSRYESFGISAAESIACGTPVLVTDKCGIAPLVDGVAGMVTPDNVEGIAAGINLILMDESLLDRLRKGCDAVARDLSWDEPAKETERLYLSLIRRTKLNSEEFSDHVLADVKSPGAHYQ